MAKTKDSLKFFISYSHKDKEFKKNLLTHLKSIELTHNVDIWHDGKILAGGEIDKEILKHLNESNIILLLISPDFMASEYCIQEELIIAMERYSKGECIIVPIMLKETIIDKELSFSNLQRVPDDGRPIQKFRPRNTGYINAVLKIKNLIDENFKYTRKTSVKEPSKPISIPLYQNGKLEPYVIDDLTWNAINTLADRLSVFYQIMNEKLVDSVLNYKKSLPNAKKNSNLDTFRHNQFKSFILDISLSTRAWLFQDVGVRVHFRILNKSKDQYIGFVVVDGKQGTKVTVNWSKKITPMSTVSSMIYYSNEFGAPLIKSKNIDFHEKGKNDDLYVDYLTSAFCKYPENPFSTNALMSMGISVETKFNKKYSSYLIALIFLKFDTIVQNYIKTFCIEIKKIDKGFNIIEIIT